MSAPTFSAYTSSAGRPSSSSSVRPAARVTIDGAETGVQAWDSPTAIGRGEVSIAATTLSRRAASWANWTPSRVPDPPPANGTAGPVAS